jgi:integrase
LANGTIKQRSKDSWTIWVQAGKDTATGKYKQRTLTIHRRFDNGKGETDKQLKTRAETELRRLLVQREDGLNIALPEKLTVSDWLDQWLAGIRPNVGERTYGSYETLLRCHVKPRVGSMLLRILRPADVRRIYAEMAENGNAGTTALHCHRVLRQALKQALRDELVTRNVADLVIAPRATVKEIAPVSVEELRRILAVADENPHYGAMVRLTLWTGMRLGEVLGLRWQDIDLESGLLRVTQTYGNDEKFRAPKTERSRRTLSIDAAIVGVLREHKRRQTEHYVETGLRGEHDLVFADPLGEPIPQHRVNYVWRAIRTKARLPSIRFHDLRHSAATLALANGVDVAVVARRLGHSTPSTTLNIYRHVMPSEDKAAAGIMSQVMGAN